MGVRTILLAGLVPALGAAQGATARIDELLRRGEELVSVRIRRADQALPLYLEAARLAARAGDDERLARAWIGVGEAHYHLHAYDEGRAALERAQRLARARGNRRTEARAIQLIANIQMDLGEYAGAEARFRELVDLGERLGDAALQVRALNSLCASARRQGHLWTAIEIGRRALAALEAARADPALAPSAHFAVPYNLGRSLIEVGDAASGLSLLQRAFDGAERHSNLGGMWHVLQDSAEWYRGQGELAKAARYFERALAKAREMDSRDPEAMTRRGLGALAEARGDLAEASLQYGAAARVFESIEMEGELPATLIALSRVQHSLADRRAAAESLARALRLAGYSKQPRAHGLALLERARQHEHAGQREAAAADYAAAAGVARGNGLRLLLPQALVGQARLAAAAGHLERAYAAYSEGAEAVESVRARMPSLEDRAAFGAASHAVYDGLLAAAVERHRLEPTPRRVGEAWLCVERERAQALRDALLESGSGASRLQEEAAALHTQLASPQLPARRRAELVARLDDAERALDAAENTGRPGPVRLDAALLSGWQKLLSADESLVVYAGGAAGMVAFVVERERLRLIELGEPGHLASRVELFVDRLRSRASLQALPAGRALTRQLVAPVLSVLSTRTRRLIVGATGELSALPFAALPDPERPDRPLLERFELAYVPSLAALARLRGRPPAASQRLLAVARPAGPPPRVPGGESAAPPELPHAHEEVERLGRRFATTTVEVLEGRSASEGTVKASSLRQFGALHFATHAVVDPREPGRSGLLLGQGPGEDGWLQPREIYRLSLESELVVLSACRTASGRASGAEGLHSLARAFAHAGARAVLGTLFDVDDEATADLIDAFYASLAQGRTAAEALREAQLRTAGDRPYESASGWAAFQIVGDPAARPRLSPAESRPSMTVALAAIIAALLAGLAATTFRARERAAVLKTR